MLIILTALSRVFKVIGDVIDILEANNCPITPKFELYSVYKAIYSFDLTIVKFLGTTIAF